MLQATKQLGVRAVASFPPTRRAIEAIAYRQTRNRPERVYMERELLPAVVGAVPVRVLYVGCASYTLKYLRYLTEHHVDCWTIDVDPTKAKWGAKRRHVIGDITRADTLFAPGHFDWVIMTGVIGWGVDTVPAVEASIRSVAGIIRHGGTLLLGWTRHSSHAMPDPMDLTITGEKFRLIERIPFESPPFDPVYDHLTRA
jgi:SAM-dependent methyltransferase